MNYRKLMNEVFAQRLNEAEESGAKLQTPGSKGGNFSFNLPDDYDKSSEGVAVEITDEMMNAVKSADPADRFLKMVELYKVEMDKLEQTTQGVAQGDRKAEKDAIEAFIKLGKQKAVAPGGDAKLKKAMRGSGRGKQFPAPKKKS